MGHEPQVIVVQCFPPESDAVPPVIPVARPVVAPYARPAATIESGFGACGSAWRALAELTVLLTVFIVTQIAAGVVLFSLEPETLPRWANVAATLVAGTLMLATVLLIVRGSGRPPASIGWRSDFLALDIGLGVGLLFVVLAFFYAITVVLAIFSPESFDRMRDTQRNIEAAFPRMTPPWILAINACVAVYEEFVFRGFLLTRLRRLVRWWPAAIVMGAAMFSVLHLYQGGMAVVMIFLLGLFLGGVFAWRRSLVPVIVLHFLFNSWQMLTLYLVSPEWT